jgi:hypothetical protein
MCETSNGAGSLRGEALVARVVDVLESTVCAAWVEVYSIRLRGGTAGELLGGVSIVCVNASRSSMRAY